MKYLYTFLAIVLTVGLQAQNTIATYDLDTVADPDNPFFFFGGNADGRTSAHDLTEGAWIIGGSNPDSGDPQNQPGAAYIAYTAEIPVNSASTTLTLEFDLKVKTALSAAAFHLTVTTPAGAVAKNDLQNEGITADSYTTISFDDIPTVAGVGFVKLEFNVAAGAVANSGGEVYIDNVAFKNATSHPSAIKMNFDTSNSWTGYMNVFDNDADGGAYLWGSPWGVADLNVVVDSNAGTAEFSPNTNTYADNSNGNGDNVTWTNTSDGGITDGDDGNKKMEATLKVEYGTTGATAFPYGSSIAFAGNIQAFDLDSRYSLKAFVKTLNPGDYSVALIDEEVIDGTGNFELEITPANGHIVQYGLVMVGLNANPITDWGSATVGQGTFAFDKVVSDFELSIYPNPASRIANISSAESIDVVRIFDLTGRVVKQATPNKSNFSLDVADLSKGVYIVKLNSGDKEAMTKLIK